MDELRQATGSCLSQMALVQADHPKLLPETGSSLERRLLVSQGVVRIIVEIQEQQICPRWQRTTSEMQQAGAVYSTVSQMER